ncbi:MAG: hypothetical protein HYU64_01890 [Armatimonadetes bacterium]|nr:hypothetical protein [Armatimonadota bacterium]
MTNIAGSKYDLPLSSRLIVSFTAIIPDFGPEVKSPTLLKRRGYGIFSACQDAEKSPLKANFEKKASMGRKDESWGQMCASPAIPEPGRTKECPIIRQRNFLKLARLRSNSSWEEIAWIARGSSWLPWHLQSSGFAARFARKHPIPLFA